jgi:hypothetical protein
MVMWYVFMTIIRQVVGSLRFIALTPKPKPRKFHRMVFAAIGFFALLTTFLPGCGGGGSVETVLERKFEDPSAVENTNVAVVVVAPAPSPAPSPPRQ